MASPTWSWKQWLAAVVGVIVAGFICLVALGAWIGRSEQKERQRAEGALTPTTVLQQRILASVTKQRGVPLACHYLGAISFRLAEAREAKVDRSLAVELSNDPYLVKEIASTGADARYVIGGLATQVYNSPLPPADMQDATFRACGKR